MTNSNMFERRSTRCQHIPNPPARTTWRNIQHFLGQLRSNLWGRPDWFVSLRQRPLLKRLLDRTPRASVEVYSVSTQCTFEEVVFLIDREGNLMADSFVRQNVTKYSDYDDEGLFDDGTVVESASEQGETIWQAVRRCDRRRIGAVVIAIFNPDRGNRWLTTVFIAPDDPGELVRWNREYGNMVPQQNWRGIKGSRPRKAGRHWH